ncbi:MAG: c-type cytochrome [Gemmatimonadota bacterium]
MGWKRGEVGAGGEHEDSREPRVFLWTAIVLLAVYLALRFLVPWLTVWMGAGERPAPVPGFARAIYLICAAFGALVYLSSEERRWRLFLGPVVRLFVLRPAGRRRSQLLVLGLLPALAGWVAWQRVMPQMQPPAALRVQHPTLPREYAAVENPFRRLPAEARTAAELEGVVLYQKNCRPCHGTKADGSGPLARGLRLRPVDFSDPGTISTLVEAYPFWRIQQGGIGLPGIATPWHSAMPAWGDELEEDDMWRIIMAEYRIAGTEPRIPEGGGE